MMWRRQRASWSEPAPMQAALQPVPDDEAGSADAAAGHPNQPALTEAHFAQLVGTAQRPRPRHRRQR